MIRKLKGKAAHIAVLAGIGATLVQLVAQVQSALDVIEDKRRDLADDLADELAPLNSSAMFAAGYTAGWSDGHEGRTPQVIPEPEGASDE